MWFGGIGMVWRMSGRMRRGLLSWGVKENGNEEMREEEEWIWRYELIESEWLMNGWGYLICIVVLLWSELREVMEWPSHLPDMGLMMWFLTTLHSPSTSIHEGLWCLCWWMNNLQTSWQTGDLKRMWLREGKPWMKENNRMWSGRTDWRGSGGWDWKDLQNKSPQTGFEWSFVVDVFDMKEMEDGPSSRHLWNEVWEEQPSLQNCFVVFNHVIFSHLLCYSIHINNETHPHMNWTWGVVWEDLFLDESEISNNPFKHV